MQASGFIDLHCDTLTDPDLYIAGKIEDTLNDPKKALSLFKIKAGTKWAQFFAVFLPDEYRGEDAIRYFEFNSNNFYRQMEKFKDLTMPCRTYYHVKEAFDKGKFASILTVEGGAVLNGEMERVKIISDAGVKSLTLVWNGENEIGSGNTTDKGLSDFGKRLIPQLEKHNIIIDVSHLNDNGFNDLLKVAKEPFIASHSNARSICSHKRNLKNDQIKEIIRRDGIIGLNYFVKFLRDDGIVKSLDDIYAHIYHFLDLGAEKNLALGSDFDGAVLPECLDSIEKTFHIYDYLIGRGLSHEIADGIMFKNAYNFFRKNLK